MLLQYFVISFRFTDLTKLLLFHFQTLILLWLYYGGGRVVVPLSTFRTNAADCALKAIVTRRRTFDTVVVVVSCVWKVILTYLILLWLFLHRVLKMPKIFLIKNRLHQQQQKLLENQKGNAHVSADPLVQSLQHYHHDHHGRLPSPPPSVKQQQPPPPPAKVVQQSPVPKPPRGKHLLSSNH